MGGTRWLVTKSSGYSGEGGVAQVEVSRWGTAQCIRPTDIIN